MGEAIKRAGEVETELRSKFRARHDGYTYSNAWSANSAWESLSPGHSDSEEISGPCLMKMRWAEAQMGSRDLREQKQKDRYLRETRAWA